MGRGAVLSELLYAKCLREYLASHKNHVSAWTLKSDPCIQSPALPLPSDAVLAGPGASISASIKLFLSSQTCLSTEEFPFASCIPASDQFIYFLVWYWLLDSGWGTLDPLLALRRVGEEAWGLMDDTLCAMWLPELLLHGAGHLSNSAFFLFCFHLALFLLWLAFFASRYCPALGDVLNFCWKAYWLIEV